MKRYDLAKTIWDSHDNYRGKEQVSLTNFDIANFMADLFCPGSFYYYILDSPTLTLDFASKNIESFFGIAPEEFSFQKLLELIHPDDIEFVMKCEDVVAYFLKNCIPPEKMVKYKISYCVRERTKNHGYRLFLLQTITLKTTIDGALLKVFGSHTDITHITHKNNKKLSFIGLHGEPSYLEIDVFQKKLLDGYTPFDISLFKLQSAYTPREIEVLRLLASGNSTNEIADKLFISFRTVETHRKNLHNKSNTKNTAELIAECIKKGII